MMDRLFRPMRLSLAAIFAFTLATSLRAVQTAYPERNITIICASGAGGIVDVTTRILADHMSRTLGRTVVVQNEPGGGSTIAIASVARAAPDGYTVLTIGPGVSVVAELYPKANVDVVPCGRLEQQCVPTGGMAWDRQHHVAELDPSVAQVLQVQPRWLG